VVSSSPSAPQLPVLLAHRYLLFTGNFSCVGTSYPPVVSSSPSAPQLPVLLDHRYLLFTGNFSIADTHRTLVFYRESPPFCSNVSFEPFGIKKSSDSGFALSNIFLYQ
jgi:hypothetical protein